MPSEVKLLDFGYLRYIEHWGSDERIIESARISTGKGFRSWYPYYECTEPNCGAWWFEDTSKDHKVMGELGERSCEHSSEPRYAKVGDEGLLNFLWSKQHTTPFEMAGAIIEVQAPIMVFREWHRHRTQSYNEASARYTPLPDLNYIPTVERLMRNSTKNKQAGVIQGAEQLTKEKAEIYQRRLMSVYEYAEELYKDALQMGIPKELARLSMTVGRYSKMRASANLLNWLKFLKLRCSNDAQEEIRVYAQALHGMLTEIYPRTMLLFKVE